MFLAGIQGSTEEESSASVKRSRRHNRQNCTILHEAEENGGILWDTLIKAQKIVISFRNNTKNRKHPV